MFGSSGLHFDGQNYSVIDRFVYRQNGYNKHVKTSLNLKLLKLNKLSPEMVDDPHHSNIGHFSINSHNVIYSPFNEEHLSDDCPYIAHFFTKTPEEWNSRRSAGRIDVPADSPERFRSFSMFKQYDLNEVLDTTLKDKLHAMMES